MMSVDKMLRQSGGRLQASIGNAMAAAAIRELPQQSGGKSQALRRQVAKLGKGKAGLTRLLPRNRRIANPEDRLRLRQELRACESLGEIRGGMAVYCYRYNGDSVVMRELGRLRELSFRAVGEGTGKRRDIDAYDAFYQHIVLWDDEALEIVGAYRLMPVAELKDGQSLYSETLFAYDEQSRQRLANAVELGRSFVQPNYWGRQGLDYLWQGIGAWLRARPGIELAFGPVSLSNSIHSAAKAHILAFYQAHFGAADAAIRAHKPWQGALPNAYPAQDYRMEFAALKSQLAVYGEAVPTLYKQYTELCEPGAVEFAAFGVDSDFADCIDGLVICDLSRMKPAKRKRYLAA